MMKHPGYAVAILCSVGLSAQHLENKRLLHFRVEQQSDPVRYPALLSHLVDSVQYFVQLKMNILFLKIIKRKFLQILPLQIFHFWKWSPQICEDRAKWTTPSVFYNITTEDVTVFAVKEVFFFKNYFVVAGSLKTHRAETFVQRMSLIEYPKSENTHKNKGSKNTDN